MGGRLLILQLQEQLLSTQPTWRDNAKSFHGWEATDPPDPGAEASLYTTYLESQGEELSWVRGS